MASVFLSADERQTWLALLALDHVAPKTRQVPRVQVREVLRPLLQRAMPDVEWTDRMTDRQLTDLRRLNLVAYDMDVMVFTKTGDALIQTLKGRGMTAGLPSRLPSPAPPTAKKPWTAEEERRLLRIMFGTSAKVSVPECLARLMPAIAEMRQVDDTDLTADDIEEVLDLFFERKWMTFTGSLSGRCTTRSHYDLTVQGQECLADATVVAPPPKPDLEEVLAVLRRLDPLGVECFESDLELHALQSVEGSDAARIAALRTRLEELLADPERPKDLEAYYRILGKI